VAHDSYSAESKHDDGYGSSDASGDEEVAVAGPGDEDEWDTSEWAPEDIKVAAATLVQEMMHEKCNAIRRAKAGELLARLASENEPARQYLEVCACDVVHGALRGSTPCAWLAVTRLVHVAVCH